MVTEKSLKQEVARQCARLAFTTDPFAIRILSASIADLVALIERYPQGLVWCADQRPEAGPPAP